jgi:hypothetical protein
MQANYQKGRQSWKQSAGSRSASPKSSLSVRRLMATVVFVGLLSLALWWVWSLGQSRYQHTRVAFLFTASRTNTNEPERPYTLAPLRYASESLAPLQAENTEEFQVASLNSSFDNADSLSQAIASQIAKLERDDGLILWVRAKGVGLNGKAYLLGGDYRLPTSGQELEAPRGTVPLQTLLAAVSSWSGPSLILLDWGNQLADARAGFVDNSFLPLAVDEIAACPPQVHCLVSHLQGEISLDCWPEEISLFGRACAEAIVGPRRAPAEYQSLVASSDRLRIGDVAEYVFRRVQADSLGRQTPWLIKGRDGWLAAERDFWRRLTDSPLVQLGPGGRPIGWSEISADIDEQAEDADASAGPTVAATNQDTAPARLKDEEWPTRSLWLALEKWSKPNDTAPDWSPQQLAPLSVRRFAAQILDLEARWFAGRDFRGGMAASDLGSRIERLKREIESQLNEVLAARLANLPPVSNSARPPGAQAYEFEQWRNSTAALAAFRNAALPVADAATMSDNLSRLAGLNFPGDLLPRFRSTLQSIEAYLQALGDGSQVIVDADPIVLTQQLRTSRQQLDASVHSLLDAVLTQPLQLQPVGELLLRYPWLTAAQRESLLYAFLKSQSVASQSGQAADRQAEPNWPTKDLVLLRPSEPSVSRQAATAWAFDERPCVRPSSCGGTAAADDALVIPGHPARRPQSSGSAYQPPRQPSEDRAEDAVEGIERSGEPGIGKSSHQACGRDQAGRRRQAAEDQGD